MRDIVELVACHEQGIYTFGEAVTAIVCEAATRDPGDLVRDLPSNFLEGVAQSACALPKTATADDCVVLKSSRAHAVLWFNGAVNWRRYFEDHSSRAAG